MADTLRKRKEGLSSEKPKLQNDPTHHPSNSSLPGAESKEFSSRNRNRPGLAIPQGSWIVCLVLTGFALWTRLYKINWNDHVVWDEAHFG